MIAPNVLLMELSMGHTPSDNNNISICISIGRSGNELVNLGNNVCTNIKPIAKYGIRLECTADDLGGWVFLAVKEPCYIVYIYDSISSY